MLFRERAWGHNGWRHRLGQLCQEPPGNEATQDPCPNPFRHQYLPAVLVVFAQHRPAAQVSLSPVTSLGYDAAPSSSRQSSGHHTALSRRLSGKRRDQRIGGTSAVPRVSTMLQP